MLWSLILLDLILPVTSVMKAYNSHVHTKVNSAFDLTLLIKVVVGHEAQAVNRHVTFIKENQSFLTQHATDDSRHARLRLLVLHRCRGGSNSGCWGHFDLLLLRVCGRLLGRGAKIGLLLLILLFRRRYCAAKECHATLGRRVGEGALARIRSLAYARAL